MTADSRYLTDEQLARTPIADNVQAAVDAGVAASTPHKLDQAGRFHVVTTPRGAEAHVVDLEQHLEWTRERPRRATGTFTVHTAESFVDYLKRHDTAETEVWADLAAQSLTAILNAHTATDIYDVEENDRATAVAADIGAGHGDHRLTLLLRQTPEWQAWAEHSGKLTTQETMAEHIEDHLDDIASPPGAEMLELVQHFHATTGVTFGSSRLLSSGERQLTYREDTQAAAGRNGQLTIPPHFDLALSPFDGIPAYRVRARFRYRIRDGHLALGYTLNRPDDVLRSAFTDQLDAVSRDLDGTVPIYRGTPPHTHATPIR